MNGEGALRIPYLLVDSPPKAGELKVSGDEAKHLLLTLRAKRGFRFVGFDGNGSGWLAELKDAARGVLCATVIENIPSPPTPPVETSTAVGVVKGSRMDWAVEKAAELGSDAFIPLLTDYSVVEPRTGKMNRWNTIALAAAKQSRRLRLMKIYEPVALSQIIAGLKPAEAWALNTGADVTPVREQLTCLKAPAKLTLLIGPEGGFSSREIAMLTAKRITLVSLGKGVMRTETAVAVALGMIANFAAQS